VVDRSSRHPKVKGLIPATSTCTGGRERESERERDNYQKLMEQHTLKNVNNCLNTNIYSYLETSGVRSSNAYLNVV
jgi:hypothetical protein